MFREFVVFRQRIEDDHDRDVSLAWQINALHGMHKSPKGLPALDTLTARGRKPQPSQTPRVAGEIRQTVAQQRAVLQMLSDYYKIPLRKAPLRG